MVVWRRLALRLKRLGVWKGVGRRTSPYRLNNYGELMVNEGNREGTEDDW